MSARSISVNLSRSTVRPRDWTISRQLWWGHQIPAWYTEDGGIIVARSREEAEQKAGTSELTQDEDVLDTWFSSALWPFSTLGWPAETEDLRTFYPTSVLITARDIIFLWVSRMMMTGLNFIGREPFDDVYVTGTILDKHGQRMSKTKGNGIDPLEVFDKYGVDATRLTLASVGSTAARATYFAGIGPVTSVREDDPVTVRKTLPFASPTIRTLSSEGATPMALTGTCRANCWLTTAMVSPRFDDR